MKSCSSSLTPLPAESLCKSGAEPLPASPEKVRRAPLCRPWAGLSAAAAPPRRDIAQAQTFYTSTRASDARRPVYTTREEQLRKVHLQQNQQQDHQQHHHQQQQQ
jgi:hypothetical protein